MLATLAEAPLTEPNLVYEPKYDGIRALIEVAPARRGARGGPHLVAQRQRQDRRSFPRSSRRSKRSRAGLDEPVVLDGEIVALDERGRPAGFQRLQGRMHLTGAADVERAEAAQPAAFIAFDILRDGKDDLCRLPLTERRARLERRS